MRFELIIFDDQDRPVAELRGPATLPAKWRTSPMQPPIVDGNYKIFGFTYQPHLQTVSDWIEKQQNRA